MANPGLGWGGTDITDPLALIQKIDPKVAWPGLRLLFTSTTGEDALYCVLDESLKPVPAEMPAPVRAVVDRIGENCEPSLCTVMFMAGAGGSLRAGVTENPVLLTRSVQSGQTRVTLGGAPAYLWPGGGITVMVDVTRLPRNAFGYVPTPAIVAPIEFTLPRDLYLATGGHAEEIVPVEEVVKAYRAQARVEPWQAPTPGRSENRRAWAASPEEGARLRRDTRGQLALQAPAQLGILQQRHRTARQRGIAAGNDQHGVADITPLAPMARRRRRGDQGLEHHWPQAPLAGHDGLEDQEQALGPARHRLHALRLHEQGTHDGIGGLRVSTLDQRAQRPGRRGKRMVGVTGLLRGGQRGPSDLRDTVLRAVARHPRQRLAP